MACGSVLMPTPSSRMVSDCSNNSQSMPRARNISAVVRPPMSPPTMIAFIRQNSTQPGERVFLPPASHRPLFGRKRLCRLRLELGPGFRLTLNFEVVEILPVADAVAENLFLSGQILRRTGDVRRAVPGRRAYRKRRVNQM